MFSDKGSHMAKRLGTINQSCIRLIKGYQQFSRFKQPCCRFYPSCSVYAIQAFERYGGWRASYYIVKRLLRCLPGLPCEIDELR